MIKKIIISLAILLSVSSARADFTGDYCAKEPYPVGGVMAHSISDMIGINALFTKVAELSMQQQLKKELDSNFNVELYSFGGKNLIDGKFKKIKISSKKINSEDIHITDFKAESLCSYNQVILKDNETYFAENFLLGYSGVVTSQNFTDTILAPKYLELIKKMDLNVLGVNLFKVFDPSVEIKNNRIYMSVKVKFSTFFVSKTVCLNSDYGLKIDDGKIVFTDINLGNTYGISPNAFLPIINMLNPFQVRFKLDDNNTMTVKTTYFDIKDNAIHIKGVVILPKNI